MSDFNYDALSADEKAVYDNAYNWGWSSAARSSEREDLVLSYSQINTETLNKNKSTIFDEGYQNGVVSYQNKNESL